MAEMKRPRRGGQTATGANVNAQTYCRLSPALGPLGDSLDDLQ
jgi:hypothetical protein